MPVFAALGGNETVEHFKLPTRTNAPRMGRHSVRRALEGSPEEVVFRVELLVSELVTNSVTHADLDPGQEVELTLTVQRDAIRIEVADPGKPFRWTGGDGRSEEGRWGLLLTDKDPVVVATAVERLRSDASLRQSLVEAGRKRVELFSIERTGPQWIDALTSLMKETG